MSVKTWIKEFYPVEADSAEAKAAPIKHSLRKWQGLLRKNLAKHGLTVDNFYNHGLTEPPIEISGETCALCQTFDKGGYNQCRKCPLYQVRKKTPCDEVMESECADKIEPEAPFYEFVDTGSPNAMISWLKKTANMFNENGKRKPTRKRTREKK